MKIVIVEDERYTAAHIARFVGQYDPSIDIVQFLHTVKESVTWFGKNAESLDLILMDIQLSDGSSFDIFDQVNIRTPIIFITAYNEYALNAFRVNSIDYLLKPIDYADLKTAFDKFFRLVNDIRSFDSKWYKELFRKEHKSYKKRFLVRIGEQYKFVQTEHVSYFEVEDRLVFARLFNGEKQFIDESLDELSDLLNPEHFFRLNRKVIVSIQAIGQIHTYFNRRLTVRLNPGNAQVVVSRERVADFKSWINS